MKAYIVPVENYCNARCFFCITKFKEESKFGGMLPKEAVVQIAELPNVETIEVTGGGEPLIHPEIESILNECMSAKPTILYTNGKLLFRLSKPTLQGIDKLTISRHHFDRAVNARIMGLDYEDQIIKEVVEAGAKVRLTAVLCQSGMKSGEDVFNYLSWTQSLGVRMVQIRQFFEYEYGDGLRKEFVRTQPVLEQLLQGRPEMELKEEKYPTVYWRGMKIEFEGDKCACEVGGPNLRGNGSWYWGWTDKQLPSSYWSQ